MRISTLASVFLLGALVGCDNGGPGAVGAPCNTADDCQGSLICDVHNDQGSCQEPHGHGADARHDAWDAGARLIGRISRDDFCHGHLEL